VSAWEGASFSVIEAPHFGFLAMGKSWGEGYIP